MKKILIIFCVLGLLSFNVFSNNVEENNNEQLTTEEDYLTNLLKETERKRLEVFNNSLDNLLEVDEKDEEMEKLEDEIEKKTLKFLNKMLDVFVGD